MYICIVNNKHKQKQKTMKKKRNVYEIKFIFRDFTRTIGNLSYKEMVRKRRIAKELGTEIEVRIVGKY